MKNRIPRRRGFTLIELLTVIAIIAVLAAILFPVAGTVREQARASDCMTKLHQLWVSANVYRQDEGSYPPALMGLAEVGVPDPTNPSRLVSSGVFLTDPTTQKPVPANGLINGFLYNEQVKDVNVYHCADNTNTLKTAITLAHFPALQTADASQPYYWPPQYNWVGAKLASICGTDSFGTIDCFNDITEPKVAGPNPGPADPLYGKPKYYYIWDSYDIGPHIDPATGRAVSGVYDRHYSTDWTGEMGASDLIAQLKYDNPPLDRTLLAFCTWHAATYGSSSVPAISLGGSAKKIDLKQVLINGPNLYNR